MQGCYVHLPRCFTRRERLIYILGSGSVKTLSGPSAAAREPSAEASIG